MFRLEAGYKENVYVVGHCRYQGHSDDVIVIVVMIVTPEGVLLPAKCDASATREGL